MSDDRTQEISVRNVEDIIAAGEDETFGQFDPRRDRDGAAKLALAAIGRGRGRQIPSLARLITENSRLGELEGEPGWTIERRDDGNNMPGYAKWPVGAKYRAYVDPESYRLPWPEVYYDRSGFHFLIDRMLQEFEKNNPEQNVMVEAVRVQL